MPFTELHMMLPSCEPVEATALRAERVCTGEPRLTPMRPKGAVPGGTVGSLLRDRSGR